MPTEFRHATLDNGLTVIAECNDEAHTAAAGFFVRSGSRDEPDEWMGVSHFLEHMVFKGTERRSAADVNRELDAIGANHNAMTSQENTIFFAHVLPEYLPQALDVLSDVMRPTLRQEDFDVEKKVILEEIGMYADRPFWQVMERAMEEFFGDHPLAHRVLGTNETVERLSRDQMLDYFHQRYSPDNIILSLAGRVDFDAAVRQIEEACGDWKPSGVGRDLGTVRPREADASLPDSQARMHYAMGICPGPSEQDERRYAATVLGHVLGDADGSRIYWRLIDPGLAEDAELSHHPYDGTGAYLFFASCEPAGAERTEAILHDVLDTADQDLTEAEVERAASKIAMDLTLQNERPVGRMMALGSQWMYLGDHIPLDEELRRIRAVTPDDLRDVMEAFPMRPRTLVRLTPSESTAATAG